MRIDDDYGVAVSSRRLLPHLVNDDVVHEGGLAHSRTCDVEVVTAQQVAGEFYFRLPSRTCVTDRRASPDAARGRHQHPGPRTLDQGRFVSGSRRVPQAGDLSNPQYAPTTEEAGTGGMHHGRVADDLTDLAHLEPRPRGWS